MLSRGIALWIIYGMYKTCTLHIYWEANEPAGTICNVLVEARFHWLLVGSTQIHTLPPTASNINLKNELKRCLQASNNPKCMYMIHGKSKVTLEQLDRNTLCWTNEQIREKITVEEFRLRNLRKFELSIYTAFSEYKIYRALKSKLKAMLFTPFIIAYACFLFCSVGDEFRIEERSGSKRRVRFAITPRQWFTGIKIYAYKIKIMF